jgi:hypothetical protein
MKSNDRSSLNIISAIIEGQYFRVEDFDRERAIEEGPKYLLKSNAYRIDTCMTHGLFPYRGIIRKGDSWSPYNTPGIYIKRSKDDTHWNIRIAYPRGKRQIDEYALSKEKDVVAAIIGNEYVPSQFIDLKVDTSKGEAFMPPVRIGDDPLNTIMKIGIRTKEAPFEPYGKRLEALAVDRSKSIEGINIRNNAKRGIITNTAMSASKFILYANTWQLKAAIILTDMEDSMHPMFADGEMLVIFPNSEPFKIEQDKLIDISDMVRDAIAENNGENREENDDE